MAGRKAKTTEVPEAASPEPPRSPLEALSRELLSPSDILELRTEAQNRLRRLVTQAVTTMEGLLSSEDESVRRQTALDVLAFNEIYFDKDGGPDGGGSGEGRGSPEIAEMLAEATRGLVRMLDHAPEGTKLVFSEAIDVTPGSERSLEPAVNRPKPPRKPKGGRIASETGLSPSLQEVLNEG